MTTIQEGQAYDAVPRIAHALNRIANVAEAWWAREREKPQIKDSLGAHALWREEVARGDCLIGFADWLAWHESDNATTPEDIENMGAAVQAVKRGFADMERQVKGEGDA